MPSIRRSALAVRTLFRSYNRLRITLGHVLPAQGIEVSCSWGEIAMAQRRLDVEKFREMLLLEKNRLLAKSRRTRNFSEDQSDEVSELSDYDNHPADAATETFERAKNLAIDENMVHLVERIDRAIEKIDDGSYGICDRCGREISRERLKVLPHATFCVECQDLVEGR